MKNFEIIFEETRHKLVPDTAASSCNNCSLKNVCSNERLAFVRLCAIPEIIDEDLCDGHFEIVT